MVPGLVSSLLTAWHPADLAQCAVQFGMLSAVLLGFAAGFVWLWPYRLRHQCYLTPACLAINGDMVVVGPVLIWLWSAQYG